MTNWEDNFDALLAWLDPDPEKAGRKYEEIRHALIVILRGCFDAEDLADEVIGRVVNKLPEIVPTYKGDPALYFYGVAKRLRYEILRRQQTRVELEDPDKLSAPRIIDELDDQEAEYECLEKCLAQLPPADRELILLYYQREQPAISFRRELARKSGLNPNALRVKVHRIRETLEECINNCLGKAT